MVAVGAGPVAAGVPAAAAVEEQTEFDVMLQDFGAEKIKVIKVVREFTDLGLRESKELVEGVPAKQRGTISIPLTIEKGERSVARPDVRGKQAVSEYRVVKPLTLGRALLTVLLRTGRTHQIRAHLASIGHPVVGDRTYGEKREEGGGELFLHAWIIRFPHPQTNITIEATAPPPPGFE